MGDESVTCTVKVAVPDEVGVPEITPVLASRESPAGGLPAVIDHKRGSVPPLACSLAEYEVPSTPAGNEIVEMVGGGFTATMSEAEAVFFATEVAFIATFITEETLAGAT
jgi:hypothetical protein